MKDLKPNKRNPRKITKAKLDALSASLLKFGDLSGFVFNSRTGALVSGHQRQKVLPQDAKIKIEVKYKEPTFSHTVAEGHVEINGERFKYREVDADPQWEAEAMLAANKHGGDWDDDVLKMIFADFPSFDYTVAGFDIPTAAYVPPDVPFAEPVAREESDEEYVKNTPKTEERIETGAGFEAVKENLETPNTRHIVILDCPSKEAKESLKEKLRTDGIADQYGAKIF